MMNCGVGSRRFIQGMAMAIAVSGMAFAAIAHEYYAAGFKIVHPWAIPTAAGTKTTEAFLRLEEISVSDRLIAARSPIAGRIDIRGPAATANAPKTTKEARMVTLKSFDFAAGADVEMSAQGVHLLLADLTGPLLDDRSYPLTLIFERAGPIETMMSMRPD